MEDKDLREEERIFGMTLDEIGTLADELCRQTDPSQRTNLCPLSAEDSWSHFLNTLQKGHERLMKLPGYNKRNREEVSYGQ
jgi:hypothetical protein